jgi:hypothetical protein
MILSANSSCALIVTTAWDRRRRFSQVVPRESPLV